MVFEPYDQEYEKRVRDNFARQPFMALLGATMERVTPGEVAIALSFGPDLTQQHGYLHAGAVTAVLDSACGYAAYTLFPADAGVLTVEFKVNLLAPARGALTATARVLRAGRRITVCAADAVAADDGVLVATMLATIIRQ